MFKTVIIAASLTVLWAATASAAGKANFPMAADGTTNIADCAKVDPLHRNECISRSRPLTGKQIYAALPAPKPVAKAAAKTEKVTAPVAKAAAPSKGFNIAKDGTTSIKDCLNAREAAHYDCISRARPLTGKELAKFEKSHAASAVSAPKSASPPPAAKKAEAAPAKPAKPAKKFTGKGFSIAKDGTTDISDCAKANPDNRNECISRSRPVKGAEIYRTAKSKSKS